MLRLTILIVALFVGGAPLRAEVTHVDNAALERLLEAAIPIIDIRTPEEWGTTGVIEGSHLLTFFDARGNYDTRAWLSDLSRHRCSRGARRDHLPQRRAQRLGQPLSGRSGRLRERSRRAQRHRAVDCRGPTDRETWIARVTTHASPGVKP